MNGAVSSTVPQEQCNSRCAGNSGYSRFAMQAHADLKFYLECLRPAAVNRSLNSCITPALHQCHCR